jgi:phosphoribosylformylglycinamidine synthase subunit PurL
LYNESPAGVVDPTPTIAMVGLIDDEKHVTTQWFKEAGDMIILVGEIGNELGGSQYLTVCHGLKIGPPPHVDLAHEIKVQNAVRDLIREGLVKSAHDCSEGGLAVALAESCFNPEKLFGAEIDCSCHREGDAKRSQPSSQRHASHREAATVLFNESQSRFIISVSPEQLEKSMSMLRERDVPFQQLGKVGAGELDIRVKEETFRWQIADLYDNWWNAIRRAVEEETERIPSL